MISPEPGAAALALAITQGQTTASAVVEDYLDRITRFNPRLNALTEVWGDEARQAARSVDAARTRGEVLGPLAGVGFTVKANLDVAGKTTTHGIPALKDAVAPLDSPLVGRLRKAGAIPLGHSNLPDLSLRFHTDSTLYGPTVNPWDRHLSPGGSSGGEGAAIGAGLSPLGLGNDAGGSVRLPALFGGIAALKPTPGRFPSDRSTGPRDLTLASQLIPVDGVLARSIEDLALVYQILSGPDVRDPRALAVPLEGPGARTKVRVALTRDPGKTGVDPEVQRSLDRAAQALARAGYEVVEADPPRFADAVDDYQALVHTEFGLSRDLFRRLVGENGRRYLDFAQALARTTDLAGYIHLTARRMGLQRLWGEWMADHPLVLGPVFARTGARPDQDVASLDEHTGIAQALALCSATSYLGLPAVAVPTGLEDGRPQGVQIIGGPFREDQCLVAAQIIENTLGRIGPAPVKIW